MPRKPKALSAKLSPPQLQHAVPRERLFAWLDRHRSGAAIWLGSPPGSGKTMLAASYLKARSARGIWYRLDADDNDLGQFFVTIGQAVDSLVPRIRRPVFSADDLNRPRSYARSWFRAVFASLPRPLVIVIDNIEQAALPSLPQVLAGAIDEVTSGITILMTSRHAPPPELSGAEMAGLLAVLPATALDFDPSEATQFARTLGMDEGTVLAVARRVNGWAAGLRLLSHAGGGGGSGDPSQSVLFAYFGELLHDRLNAEVQHLLLVSALLPWIPADLAGSLAGVADAEAHLALLCANNLFIERVAGSSGVYRLHPLFREFLLERAMRMLGDDERRRLLSRAAREFLQRRQTDIAIDLFLDAGDADAAVEQLLAAMEDKLALSQLDQVAAWIRRLPTTTLDDEPYLRYGLARVCLLREDVATQEHYERACAVFLARDDLYGQQLCAAGILEWGYNIDSFIGHKRWSTMLRQPLPAGATPRCEQHALRLLNGRLLACFFGGDYETESGNSFSEVLDALEPGGAENEKLFAAVTLLGCLERHKRWDEAHLLAGKMESMLRSPRLGTRLKILVRQQIAVDLYRQTGAYADARKLALMARAQAQEHEFAALEFEAVAILLFLALYTGDDAEARKLLDELSGMVDPGNVYHQRFIHQMLGWLALQQGRLATAREHVDALRAAVDRSDMPAHFRATWLQVPIYAAYSGGDAALALSQLEQLCADAEPGSRSILKVNLGSLRALTYLRAGRTDDAAQALETAWHLSAGVRYYQLLAPMRAELAQLAEFALERGIVTTFARELIARRRLRPGSGAMTHWPWPVRVYTLGRFAVHVDGEPLRFEGKVPKKPLMLLKALIAFGAEGVPVHVLTDALWADDEADAAHDAFNVALHRLRKLIPRGAEHIQLHDGRVGLDPGTCWVDSRDFEQLIADSGAGHEGEPRASEALRQALELYRGHFLAEDTGEPWSVSTRERLRSKYRRTVMARGRALSEAGRDEDAMECYRHGLDTDDLTEEFYQGVMRSAMRLRRPAEGIAAYQRLQRVLAMLLGVVPSAETESLLRQLLP